MKKNLLRITAILCIAALGLQLSGCSDSNQGQRFEISSRGTLNSDAGDVSSVSGTASKGEVSEVASSAASDVSKANDSKTTYSGVISNFKKIAQSTTMGNLGDKIQDGEFASPNPEKEYQWSSMLADLVGWNFEGIEKAGESFGYTIKDINGDGTDELIFLLKNNFILAIYSAADSNPQLLDAYWSRHYAAILYGKYIYTYGADSAKTFQKKIERVANKKNELETVGSFGSDNGKHYKTNNGKTIELDESEYSELSKKYPDSLKSFLSATKQSGVGFTPMF